jgi:ubiquinone/menaquinone biosynthesis C-methylase UbiE
VENLSDKVRNGILDYYYQEVYKKYLFSKSLQSSGIAFFEKSVEKYWTLSSEALGGVLELGSGQGEHLPYVHQIPQNEYVCLDLRDFVETEALESLDKNFKDVLKFIVGNAENIPFEDSRFDRTFSTCLLHHCSDPLQVLMEARRVTKPGGELAFALPTDPGLLNQLVKRIVSARRMRKFTTISPWLIYSLEHQNHISGLLELIKLVFKDDDLKLHYTPFKIRSWNFNLACVVHVKRSAAIPNYLEGTSGK